MPTAACIARSGEVVIFVTSDLAYPSQVDTLVIEAVGPSGNAASTRTMLSFDINRIGAWPRSISLYPLSGGAENVTVTARGILGANEVVSRSVTTRFAPGQSHLLWMQLLGSCDAQQCGTSNVCGDSSCPQPETPIDSLPLWSTERLAPESLTHVVNLTTETSAITDDPSSPDDRWLTRIDPSHGTEVVLDFPTPRASLRPGPFQEFRVWVRRVGPGTNPAIACLEFVELDTRIPGTDVNVGASVRCDLVTSTSGQMISGYADAGLLSDRSGGGVGLYVWSNPATGSEDSIEVGAVQWIASEER
jgi:hypothetical protein